MTIVMKKINCIFICAVLLISMFSFHTYAQENSVYEETRQEISLEHLSISVVDGKQLRYMPKPAFLSQRKALNEKEKLDILLEKMPKYKNVLIEAMNHNTPIHTISIVDVPLVFQENHYERVKKENNSLLRMLVAPLLLTASAADSNVGAESSRGNFVMAMSISKVFNKQEQRYKYMTITTGQWKAHSVIGGQNYPAMGEDVIAVTSPRGTVMDTSSLSAIYSNYNGQTREGKDTGDYPDFWKESSDDNYCAYAIKEDPLWTYQLDYFSAVTTFIGTNDARVRKAVSKYVHSWSSVEFTIEVSKSGWEETTISITPNRVEKTWECACDVTFNF